MPDGLGHRGVISITGSTFRTQWSYDAMDRLAVMTYPGGNSGQAGEQVTTTYNTAGLPTSLTGSPADPYVGETQYTAAGAVDLRKLGPSATPKITVDYTYYDWDTANGRGRLHLISNALQVLTYTYDAVGNVTLIDDGTDHLGSQTLTATSSGSFYAEVRYYAWGNDRWTSDQSMPTTYRFTGQVFDSNIALYYYGARYYDPSLGRFLQPDTVVPGAGNPQALNRYAYTFNNPLRYIDPSGHWPCADGVCAPNQRAAKHRAGLVIWSAADEPRDNAEALRRLSNEPGSYALARIVWGEAGSRRQDWIGIAAVAIIQREGDYRGFGTTINSGVMEAGHDQVSGSTESTVAVCERRHVPCCLLHASGQRAQAAGCPLS